LPCRLKLLRVVALLLCKTVLDDKSARLQGLLFKAVFTKDRTGFVQSIKANIVWHILISILTSTIDYYVTSLRLDWQDRMYAWLKSLGLCSRGMLLRTAR